MTQRYAHLNPNTLKTASDNAGKLLNSIQDERNIAIAFRGQVMQTDKPRFPNPFPSGYVRRVIGGAGS